MISSQVATLRCMAQEYGWNVTRPIKSKTVDHGLPESFRIKRMLDLGALALILGTVALPVPTAWAVPTDYVISGAATTTNGVENSDAPRLTNAGDTLTITATGSVTTTGLNGVETMVGGTTITHNGPIITTGTGAHGILAGTVLLPITGDVTILGRGTITTAGDNANGILSSVGTGDATITAGDISTEGRSAYGIYLDVISGNATITTGDVSTQGYLAWGIVSEVITGNTTITAGDISTAGYGASGFQSYSTTGNATITAGDISTLGDQADGIWYVSEGSGDATITTGDISMSGDGAVGILLQVTNGNSTITAANISTQSSDSIGIAALVDNGNSTITTGDISTQDDGAHGILSNVSTGNATITAGDISTAGDNTIGILSNVSTGNATITAGNISTAGYSSHGIGSNVTTGNATITAGNISTTGDGADGIYAGFGNLGAANLSFVNDYNIAVSGVNASGIYLDTLNDNSSIVNNGTISSAQSYGIFASGSGTTITNSGTISGALGAVKFTGAGNTLTLLAGSNVQGILDLAGDGGNSLVIGRRLNTALRFTAVPEVATETNGMPYVAFGGILAVVDPTLFAAEDDMVADLSRSIGNAIDTRLGSAVGQSVNTIMASTSNAQATGSQWDTWATGLASYRQQGEEGLYDGFDTTLGGFALGSDTVLSSGTRFGGFVGASRAHLNTNAGNEQIDSASTYAGIYAGYTLPDAFVNLGLTAGYANADTSRDVLNNMVAGGIEQAKGNPDGTFLTPQATLAPRSRPPAAS